MIGLFEFRSGSMDRHGRAWHVRAWHVRAWHVRARHRRPGTFVRGSVVRSGYEIPGKQLELQTGPLYVCRLKGVRLHKLDLVRFGVIFSD